MSPDTEIFKRVAGKDYLDLMEKGNPRYDRVASLLRFKDKDIAHATGVPVSSIRMVEHRIPPEVIDRIREWAQAINPVAEYFDGNPDKTILWFTIANPLLGGITPRDMIRIGRFDRLYRFIMDALADNSRTQEAP